MTAQLGHWFEPLIPVLLVTAMLMVMAAAATQARAADAAQLPRQEPGAYRVLEDRPDRLIAELPNRMIVVAQELRTAPVVSVQTWVKTGSVYEQEHIGAGLSHFLEHLVAGGTTTNRPERESDAVLGRIGARMNAATGLDTVRYYINTTAEHAPEAIDLLSDWIMNCAITPEEYRRERDVIQKEFAMGAGDPARILWKLTQQARYQTHPARHPTIGYLDEFLTVTRDEIYDFYRRMYVPNNMVFVVVGDIDRRATVEQVARLWSGVEPRPLPELSFPVEPELDGPRTLTGTADIRRPRVRLAWPGTRVGQSGDYALDLLGVILGQGESSRLVRSVRDGQRLVNSVQAYNFSFTWAEGFFGVDAEVRLPERGAAEAQPSVDTAVEMARAAILEQVRLVRDNGVTSDELARAKRISMARVVYGAQAAEDVADRVASDIIGMGDPDYLDRYVEAIQSVTADELQQAAGRFLRDDRLISVYLMPQKPGDRADDLRRNDPPTPQGQAKQPVEIDNSGVLTRLGKALAQSQANRAAIESGKLESFVLPNGLRLLVGRNTVAPAVAIHLYSLGGLLAEEPGREGLANATATMQMKGTTTRSAQQIAQTIEDLGAGLSTTCGNNSFATQATCLAQDWPTVLELLADVTLNPTFPGDEWDKLRPRLVDAIDRQRDSWNGELRDEFRQAYFGQSHPWSQGTLGRRGVVEKLTVDDLRQFHRDHLGARESVIAVIGDVDPKAVHEKVKALFASMPETYAQPFEAPAPTDPVAKLTQVKTNKPLAAAQIGFGPGVRRTSPDFAALEVLSRVLSSFPTGWLEGELRGRGPGLVYAVGAGNVSGYVPGYFTVLFNSQPGSVAQALSRGMAVADRAREELVDEPTLARAKAAVLTGEFLGKQSLADLATEAALNELYGLPHDAQEQFLRDVQAVTAEQLRVIAQTYLRNPVVVVLSHEPVPQEQLDAALATKHATAPGDN